MVRIETNLVAGRSGLTPDELAEIAADGHTFASADWVRLLEATDLSTMIGSPCSLGFAITRENRRPVASSHSWSCVADPDMHLTASADTTLKLGSTSSAELIRWSRRGSEDWFARSAGIARCSTRVAPRWMMSSSSAVRWRAEHRSRSLRRSHRVDPEFIDP